MNKWTMLPLEAFLRLKIDKYPYFRICFGVILILISNVIYIMVNYLVSWTKINAGEVDLIRGLMQIAIFGGFTFFNKLKKKDGKQGSISLFQWSMMGLYGVLISSVNITALAAIPLMPIGDLIVLCFTSPVFSVIFEFLILRRSVKILSIVLCLLIGETMSFLCKVSQTKVTFTATKTSCKCNFFLGHPVLHCSI